MDATRDDDVTPTPEMFVWLGGKLTEEAMKADEAARIAGLRAPSMPDVAEFAHERAHALRWLASHLPDLIASHERLAELDAQRDAFYRAGPPSQALGSLPYAESCHVQRCGERATVVCVIERNGKQMRYQRCERHALPDAIHVLPFNRAAHLSGERNG